VELVGKYGSDSDEADRRVTEELKKGRAALNRLVVMANYAGLKPLLTRCAEKYIEDVERTSTADFRAAYNCSSFLDRSQCNDLCELYEVIPLSQLLWSEPKKLVPLMFHHPDKKKRGRPAVKRPASEADDEVPEPATPPELVDAEAELRAGFRDRAAVARSLVNLRRRRLTSRAARRLVFN
jgi:hypothetical protein